MSAIDRLIVLLQVRQRALRCGYAVKFHNGTLRIATGGTRTVDVRSARRMLELPDANALMDNNQFWLVVAG